VLFKALFINDIDQDIIIKKLSTHTYKLGMKNVKKNKIDQHKNVMYQMESLERTFTLASLAHFIVFAHFEN
jgi:hypothetical protein